MSVYELVLAHCAEVYQEGSNGGDQETRPTKGENLPKGRLLGF